MTNFVKALESKGFNADAFERLVFSNKGDLDEEFSLEFDSPVDATDGEFVLEFNPSGDE